MGTEAATLDVELNKDLTIGEPGTGWPILHVVAWNWLEYRLFIADLRRLFERAGIAAPVARNVATFFDLSGLESPVIILTENHAKNPDWSDIGNSLEARDARPYRAADFLGEILRRVVALEELKARMEAEAAADAADLAAELVANVADAEPSTLPFSLEEDGEGDGPYLADLGLEYEPIRPYELVDEITRDFHTSPKGYVTVSRETRTITFRYLD